MKSTFCSKESPSHSPSHSFDRSQFKFLHKDPSISPFMTRGFSLTKQSGENCSIYDENCRVSTTRMINDQLLNKLKRIVPSSTCLLYTSDAADE